MRGLGSGLRGGRDGAPFVADDLAEHPRAFLEDGRELEAVRALEFEAELPDVARLERGHDQGVVSGYVEVPDVSGGAVGAKTKDMDIRGTCPNAFAYP